MDEEFGEDQQVVKNEVGSSVSVGPDIRSSVSKG